MNTRHKIIPAVYLIVEKNKKILLMKRKNTGWNDGKYGLISGHLEGVESAKSAIIREAFEETGIKIKPEDLEFIHLVHKYEKDSEERMDLLFIIKTWHGNPKNLEPEKCTLIKWFDFKNLPKNLIPSLKEVLNSYLKGELYLERGFKN